MKFRLSGFLLIGNTIQFLLIYKKNKIIEDVQEEKKELHETVKKYFDIKIKLHETIKLLESKTENKCDLERFFNKYKIKTSIDHENKIKTTFIENNTEREFDLDYSRSINKQWAEYYSL